MTMRFLLIGLLLSLLVFPLAITAATGTERPDMEAFVPGELLVLLDDGVEVAQLAHAAAEIEVLDYAPRSRVARARVPVGREAALASQLQHVTGIRHVDLHHYMYAASAPNDPFYASQQWNMHIMDAEGAWALTRGHEDIVVAIIDSGVDYEHPDLGDNLWYNPGESLFDPGTGEWTCLNDGEDSDGNGYVDDCMGWDWVDENNEPLDRFWHGTHVAGVVAATTDNEIGVASLGWNVRYMNLRVLDSGGFGFVMSLVHALEYALEHDAQVANLSLTLSGPNSVLHSVIKDVYAEGLSVVSASGNNGRNAVSYPAAWPETIAVGATTRHDVRASFSNYGAEIDVVAPGESVFSTYWPNPQYWARSGTSMATPHVSGLIGLMLSVQSGLSPEDVRTLLALSADDVNAATLHGRDPFIGWGRINARRGVAYAMANRIQLTMQGGEKAVPVNSVGNAITAQIVDEGGSPLPADDLELRWSASAGSVEPDASGTDTEGRAQGDFAAPTNSGPVQITAAAPHLGVTGTITVEVTGASPVTMTLLADRGHVPAGQKLGVKAALFDAWGNPAEDGGVVSFSSDAGTFQEADVISEAGIAPAWFIAPPIHGTAQITATTAALAPVSLSVDVWRAWRFAMVLHNR